MQKKRERKHIRERERVREWRGKKGKYIFYMWGVSPKFIFRLGQGQRGIWELAVVFVQNGGEEGKNKRKKKKKHESSPIQLGEGTSTVRQGFIQEGFSPSLDERTSHSSPACVMHFVSCTDVCASLCMQQVNWKVCLSYIWSTESHLSLAAREVAFFFPYFFTLFSQ